MMIDHAKRIGLGLLAGLWLAGLAEAAQPVRVLLITGGHAYDTNEFRAMFQAMPGVQLQTATHPNAHAWLRPDRRQAYDVLVLYDFWQPITAQAKQDFVDTLKSGKGLVVLHHAIANYQKWPEYWKIIGGRYYLQPTVVDGVTKPRSKWKHGVDIKVHIVDPQHPVTRGLKDFVIHDETYNLFDRLPGSHLLLTADAPTSAREIGWAKTYEGTRVVYIQLGHDRFAYGNPNYSRLVHQAIEWVAGRRN